MESEKYQILNPNSARKPKRLELGLSPRTPQNPKKYRTEMINELKLIKTNFVVN